MAMNYVVTRRHIMLLYIIFTSFFTNNINPTTVVKTPSFTMNRYKRALLFRPLFVYKHRQLQHRERLRNIKEFYAKQQQHNLYGDHLENYPATQIRNEFYQSLPINQLYNAEQQYQWEDI